VDGAACRWGEEAAREKKWREKEEWGKEGGRWKKKRGRETDA
jgi:hypothetical protein